MKLLFLLVSWGWAACVEKIGADSYREPATLKAVLECQRLERAEFLKKPGISNGDRVRFQEAQREEVDGFLRRHPDQAASTAEPAAETAGKPKPKNTAKQKAKKAAKKKSKKKSAGLKAPAVGDLEDLKLPEGD